MRYDLYLSYSGRYTYLTCPKKYWFRYVEKQKVSRDPRHAMLGIVLGKLFEWFYNDKIWADPDPLGRLLRLSDLAMDHTFHREGFDPDDDPEYVFNMKQKLQEVVPEINEVVKKHKLLTSHSRSEVDMTIDFQTKSNVIVRLGGRADFIHGTGQNVMIVDGKASKYREKYADPEQLIWYATQHYLKYHVAPARIGFLFYLFPNDPLQWIKYDSDSLRNSAKLTMEVVDKIMAKEFSPRPSKLCWGCDYRDMCPEGIECVSFLKSKDKVESSIFDLELIC